MEILNKRKVADIKFTFVVAMLFAMSFSANAKLSQKSQKTIVSGIIPEAESEPRKVSIDIYTQHYEVMTEKGYFRIELPVNEVSPMGIRVDSKPLARVPLSNRLFIEPGDSLFFEIRGIENLRFENIFCTGKGSEKIRFMKESSLKGQEYGAAHYDDFKADSMEWRVPYSLKRAKLQLAVLTKYKNHVNPDMYDVLRCSVIDGGLGLLSSVVVTKLALGRKDLLNLALEMFAEDFTASFRNPTAPIALGTGSYYYLYIQMAALTSYAKRTNNTIDIGFFERKKQRAYYEILTDYLIDHPNKEVILYSFVERNIRQSGLTPEISWCAASFLKSTSSNSIYHVKIDSLLEKEIAKKESTNLSNFTFYDKDDQPVQLKQYAGKVVVLDFWFTGCNGCRDAKPHIEKIEKALSDSGNVVFLSISIDRDKQQWEKLGVGKYSSATATQLYTGGKGANHPIISFLNFNSYPSFFILGKRSEIIAAKKDIPDIQSSDGKEAFVGIIKKALSLN